MRKLIVLFACVALLCGAFATADAVPNANAKWAMHYAGVHNSKTNTCDFTVVDCSDIVTLAPSALGRYDIYIVAVDVVGITATRYGICCAGPFYFYGWTSCSDLELPTTGWPACNEGNAQTWGIEQPGPHVTCGILDVYHYGGVAVLKVCEDPRVGFAEFCDGTEPNPICYKTTDIAAFGCVGFNCEAYNPCSEVPVENTSWGKLKSIYR